MTSCENQLLYFDGSKIMQIESRDKLNHMTEFHASSWVPFLSRERWNPVLNCNNLVKISRFSIRVIQVAASSECRRIIKRFAGAILLSVSVDLYICVQNITKRNVRTSKTLECPERNVMNVPGWPNLYLLCSSWIRTKNSVKLSCSVKTDLPSGSFSSVNFQL